MIEKKRIGQALSATVKDYERIGALLLVATEIPDSALEYLPDDLAEHVITSFVEAYEAKMKGAAVNRPGPGSAAGAAGMVAAPISGSEGAGGMLWRDTSYSYLRTALGPISQPLGSKSTTADLQCVLEGSLVQKLPAWGIRVECAVMLNPDIMKYVIIDQQLASSAESLSAIVGNALDVQFVDIGSSEYLTAFKAHDVVGKPLLLAMRALGLDVRVDRNTLDTSGATERRLRPDFLCWLGNVLLFKGEEKAEESDLSAAIRELGSKMADTWEPVLLPGISMPCMLGYAAAGNLLQFFVIRKNWRGAVQVDPISSRYNLSKPMGRIQSLHCTCNIVRLMASYSPRVPQLSVALGNVIQAKDPSGAVHRTVTFFEGFVRKCVFNFQEHHAGVNDFSTLQELYTNTMLAQCANLARLHGPSAIRLDGTTLVLHLAPLGVPLYGPPQDEASLKRAIRDVLTGLAALHAAGFVHRDIRWANVVRVPGSSLAADAADTFVLIDLEHAGRRDCAQDCRQPPFPLASWPAGILDEVDGRYTSASDLCLVSHCLLPGLASEQLSPSGVALKHALAARQLSVKDALAHEWLRGV